MQRFQNLKMFCKFAGITSPIQTTPNVSSSSGLSHPQIILTVFLMTKIDQSILSYVSAKKTRKIFREVAPLPVFPEFLFKLRPGPSQSLYRISIGQIALATSVSTRWSLASLLHNFGQWLCILRNMSPRVHKITSIKCMKNNAFHLS